MKVKNKGNEDQSAVSPIVWADRLFFEFRRLYPTRKMIVLMFTELESTPDLSVIQEKFAKFAESQPRLRCIIDTTSGRSPVWRQLPDWSVKDHVTELIDSNLKNTDDVLRPRHVR
jgi:hypothetical protein